MDHQIVILLGSNIYPKENLRQALKRLSELVHVQSTSKVWETLAVGSTGPKFLNTAVLINSPMDFMTLKHEVLDLIEEELGRKRTSDKNAPRTIDLDIIVYDTSILDDTLWERVHMALPIAELEPGLINPNTGESLIAVAERLHKKQQALEDQLWDE
jgi:2-amino-4-hydroxy-6-hydroxymethyldihydropteridine diphosphokinase